MIRNVNPAALTISAESAVFPALSANDVASLNTSVAERGILQPIIVRAGTNEVIDGRHRVAAAIAAGLLTVPVVEAHGDAADAAVVANMERRTMTPSQRGALAASTITRSGRAAIAAAAARFHVSPSIVSAALRLAERAGTRDALRPVIDGGVSVWSALRAHGVDYRPAAVAARREPAPVAVVAEPAPVAAPVVSAPVPAGLTEGVAAVVAAFAAGVPVGEAMRGLTADAAALDALASYMFAAADIVANRA